VKRHTESKSSKRIKVAAVQTSEPESATPEARRSFLKAGIGLAAGASLVAAAGSSAAEAEAPVQGGPVKWDQTVDVVVCGAGNGGMSAALAAATGGAKTLVLEISIQVGGNTLMSGGVLHTAGQRTWEDYNKFTFGMHDQVLGKVFVETFWNEYIPWLQSQNAYISRPTPETIGYWGDWMLGHGEPGQLRHKMYFDSLMKGFTAAGGKTMLQTRVVKLFTDTEGRVIGVRAKTWRASPKEENQKFINIRARKTIMAIGGWIMDGEKKQKYLGGPVGDFAEHMCGPFSSGEGIEMCQAVGAGMSKHGWSTFSGNVACVTATPLLAGSMEGMLQLWREKKPEEWSADYSRGRLTVPVGWLGTFTQLGNPSKAILVNHEGKRFIDESSPVLARYPRHTHAIARQSHGFAWLIADKKIYDATPGAEARIKQIIDEGGILGTNGNVIVANSLTEFADALARASVARGAFLRTIAEYNKAVDENKQEELEVSHFTGNNSGGYAIRTPPFYAIPVRSDPYFLFGGIRMDQDGRALDPQSAPISNLYVPPPLGGSGQSDIYMGGIGCAGTFGFRAGRHAARSLKA
jgi:hypothetical protein